MQATRALSREEYFNLVVSTLRTASSEVFGVVTGSRPRTEIGRRALLRIVDSIEELSRKGVKIRYLMPMREESLGVGYMYTRRGAEVKYFPGLMVQDFRYMVVDGKVTVIGLPERVGSAQPTRLGYKIASEGLAALLKSDFEARWNSREAASYEEYCKMVINRIRKTNPDVSNETIASHLGIPVDEVARLGGGES